MNDSRDLDLVQRIRALHVHEANGYGPGDCHCEECQDTMDLVKALANSVVQPWLSGVPWKQQSILFSGLRGPDVPNVPAIKRVNRWMRSITQHNADPSKPYMDTDPYLPGVEELTDELEFLPCHYVHHLADALAVIAYRHPDPGVARQAYDYHAFIAEELFHFVPEHPDVFRWRHRDKRDGRDPDKLHPPEQRRLTEAWMRAYHSEEYTHA